jgi:molybdopterin-guanine dinucleotide biosynthesis protein A
MALISGILLAGGKSSRMGSNKAFLRFKKRYLFEFPLSLLQKYCDDVIISASVESFESYNFNIVPDLIPDLGPMGGLLSCLPKIKHDRALILSCDIPFITKNYCEFLISESDKHEIIVGQNNDGYPEPLAGIYSKQILRNLRTQIERRNYKMSDLIYSCETKIFSVEKAGFNQEIFININTKEDFEAAKRIFS